MTTTVDGWDATGAQLDGAPHGQGATYTTGSDGIAATPAQLADRPGIVRICQDAGATDETADVLDIETGAATVADAAGWIKRARASYAAGKRPGQREPALYRSGGALRDLFDVLDAARVTGRVWIWVAHWGVTPSEAAAQVAESTGDRPLCGFQYHNHPDFDEDIWLSAWLGNVSAKPAPKPAPSAPTVTEQIMQQLPELKPGDTGAAVRTLQGLLVARHYRLGTTGAAGDGVDGNYGPLTETAVREAQDKAGIHSDGITGPATWPVLAGV